MRLTKGLWVLAALLVWGAPSSRAQSVEDCDSLGTRQSIEERHLIPGCLKPITNRESLISVSNLIHHLVAGELLRDGAVIAEPAGLVMNNAGDVRDRLSGQGPVRIEPTADVAEPVPQRKWNMWADGKYSWIEGEDEISSADGPLINVIAGIDYRITDRFVLGLMAMYEDSKLESPDGAGTETQGWGGGAYLGITLTDNIVFSALVNYSFIDNDYDLVFSTADTDSDRVQASAGFTGYWYSSDNWRWSPSITGAWSGEWIDEYSDNLGSDFAEQQVETAVLSFGNQFGKTFALSGGGSVEPWAGAIVEYTFLNQTETDDAPDIDYDDTVDIRLQGGLNLSFAENVQLALTGEVAGLLLDETDTYAGEANLAIQF